MRGLCPVRAWITQGKSINLIPKDAIDMTERMYTTQLRDDIKMIEITVSWLNLKRPTHQVRESSKGRTYICNATAPPARHAQRYQIHASCRLK